MPDQLSLVFQRPVNNWCGNRRRPLADRFWEKVDRSGGPDACWPWRGATVRGYGHIGVGSLSDGSRRMARCNRVAYELAVGHLPDGAQALHSCDNRLCCNPAHLFAGTQQDNMTDKVRKGRQNRGDTHWQSRLSPHQVLHIRHRYAAGGCTYASLAVEYGVSASAVGAIIRRQRWMSLPGQ